MLSRVADNLYWMSRYLERAEHTARLLSVHLNLVLDLSDTAAQARRIRMLTLLNAPIERVTDDDELFHVLAFEPSNPNSILTGVRAARENARQVREQINQEMWQELNELYLRVGSADHSLDWSERNIELCEDVIERSQLFTGITDATMNHGQGWQFIQVGRNLERSDATARLLDLESRVLWVKPESRLNAGQPVFLEWLALLRSCAAFEAYSKIYTFDVQPTSIAEFLLLNGEFPRSAAFSITAIHNALGAISESAGAGRSNPPSRLAGRLQAKLEYTDINEIITGGMGKFLADLQHGCNEIHNAVYDRYIAYTPEKEGEI